MSRLDNLRKEAKRWLKALREPNHAAWTRFRAVLPGAPAQPVLRDVQHALAREHGFENWAAFTRALDTNLAVHQFDRLASDLVVAYERGDPDAMQRLAAQFGGRLTWDDLRQGVHQRLATTPKAGLPAGPFALPHARQLIAGQLGFENWDALVEGLTTKLSALTREAQPGVEFDPGMIDPVEVRAGLAVKLFDGTLSTMTEVWGALTAARNGDLDRLIDLAGARPSLVRCDYNYMPPLHLAVRENHIDVVRFLLGRGAAKPKYETYPYRESLVVVARDRGYEPIARLLEESMEPSEEFDGGEIQYPPDPERDAFQRLVNDNALADVEAMLDRRPDLVENPFFFWGEGVLSMPANRGHRKMIDLLLRYGARVPNVSKWGAWYYFKRYDVAAMLLERGMNPNHMNAHHTTLLHDMAYTGDVAKAQLLLAHGARINAVDEEFRSTPLGVAARFGRIDSVRLLLDRGADPEKAAAEWATPLAWARKKGHREIERLLAGVAPRASGPRPAAPTPGAPEQAVVPPSPPPPQHLPVRPRLEALEREVESKGGGQAVRADVARSYGLESWDRLVLACRLIDAIWRDEPETVTALIGGHPRLLHENARGGPSCNWGPPMSYAANLGRNRIIRLLHDLGARDMDRAMGRALLQGQADTVRMLYELGARPPESELEGPAETLNATGMALLLELGVTLTPENAPVAMVLQTYSRNPAGKHRILELFVEHGVSLPDTPVMALHRGRRDLLEEHLRRDPLLFSRTFSHRDIYPRELGCDEDESLALHGTPLAGTGLLHMCADFGEWDLAPWMVERGADVNLRARIDAGGFGGQTPLFNSVVSQANRCGGQGSDRFARLLLEHGADPRVRASLRKRLRFVEDETLHEYLNVTPYEWGERFHDQAWVNPAVMDLLRGL